MRAQQAVVAWLGTIRIVIQLTPQRLQRTATPSRNNFHSLTDGERCRSSHSRSHLSHFSTPTPTPTPTPTLLPLLPLHSRPSPLQPSRTHPQTCPSRTPHSLRCRDTTQLAWLVWLEWLLPTLTPTHTPSNHSQRHHPRSSSRPSPTGLAHADTPPCIAER